MREKERQKASGEWQVHQKSRQKSIWGVESARKRDVSTRKCDKEKNVISSVTSSVNVLVFSAVSFFHLGGARWPRP